MTDAVVNLPPTPHPRSRAPRDNARPALDERTRYVPRSTQERFIVPLLAAALDELLQRHARRGGRVLDVGCGGQPLRTQLERSGMTYAGLDTQAQPGVPLDFECGIDTALPDALLESAPFDVIVCTEVLEHVADWAAAWQNLARLLAPEGVLIVTAPFVYPLHEEPYDFFRPTSHAMRHWAGRVGLEVVEVRQLGTAWEVLGTIIGGFGPKRVPGSFWSVPLTFLVRQWRKASCWFLATGALRRMVRTNPAIYLSNVCVFRRPARGARERQS